jgi:hypothetical protein
MSGLRKLEQAAIEAVARHFSATWEKGGEERTTGAADLLEEAQ